MGKKSKTKGKTGELEASAKLGELLGVPVARSQQYKGGQHSADLDLPGRLHFEVKRAERLNVYDAMTQAATDAGDNLPIVVHRRNRQPWVVICYLDDLVDVAGEVTRIKRSQKIDFP